jgi:hypothetical protein
MMCNQSVPPSCRSKARQTLRRNLISISLTTGLHVFPFTLDTLNFVSISCLLAPTNNPWPLALPSGAEAPWKPESDQPSTVLREW